MEQQNLPPRVVSISQYFNVVEFDTHSVAFNHSRSIRLHSSPSGRKECYAAQARKYLFRLAHEYLLFMSQPEHRVQRLVSPVAPHMDPVSQNLRHNSLSTSKISSLSDVRGHHDAGRTLSPTARSSLSAVAWAPDPYWATTMP